MKFSGFKSRNQGFTLPEMMISVVVLSIIAAVATPTYLKQGKANCQRAIESQMAQILTKTQVYNDEFGEHPEGWKDLSEISTLVSTQKTSDAENFGIVRMPTCNYLVSGTQNNSEFIFTAYPENGNLILPEQDASKSQEHGSNIKACINTATGSSDIRRGDGITGAVDSNLSC
jgi:prepilin-type N-terminal cleavage/methylation domain-containing protein